jgi:3-hydroxybutyrate dehydrogenase
MHRSGFLTGKAAIVTGSVEGIGFAIAQALAEQGCAAERVAALKSLGAEAVYHGVDLAQPDQIADMVTTADRKFGKVDIVVNNAVTRHWAPIEDLPVDKWMHALGVNLSAPFHVIRLTVPGMKRRRWGRIINIASNYGLQATAQRTDYCTTKHGIVGMTKVVALEGAEFGITANAICPGATDTPFIRKRIAELDPSHAEADATASFLERKQPTRRLIPPGKIGALAAFLCSDDASEITGTPISIDGGWVARA